MLFTSRSRSLMLGVIPPSARRLRGRGPRPRATVGPLLVEPLEERVLLSRGSSADGSSADRLFAADPTKSLPKPQVVQMDIAKLVAEGINVPAQAGRVQDGRVSVLRFDKYYLIGSQFYQYASGPGYPLVPVVGPALQGDIGVQHGPIPVLLPQQEPAFTAIPAPPDFAGPAPATAYVPVESPGPGAVTTPTAPATVAGAGIVAITPSVVPTATLGTNAAINGISSPSAPATPATPGNPLRDGIGAPAASTTAPLSAMAAFVLAESPGPGAAPGTLAGTGIVAITPSVVPTAAASATPATPALTSDPHRDATVAVAASTTAPQPSRGNPAPTGILGTVAAETATVATIPVVMTATPGRVSPPFPMADGSELILAPDSSGPRGVPVPGLPGQDVGPTRPRRANTARGWDSMPVAVAMTSATADGNRPALPFDTGLPAEVVDQFDFEAMERGGLVEGADPDSEGVTDSGHGLVGFAVASVIGLAWGNFVFTSRSADRHDDEEAETPKLV